MPAEADTSDNMSTYIPELAIGANQKISWGSLNTAVKDPRFLSFGESYDEVNWITGRDGDNIQLRRGYALLGQDRYAGGQVTGLGVGQIANSEIPYFSAGRKIFYYDLATDAYVEIVGYQANVVVNGGFVGSAASWTLGTNWAYGTNNIVHTPGSQDAAYQNIGATDQSKTYRVRATIGGSAGNTIIGIGTVGVDVTGPEIAAGSGAIDILLNGFGAGDLAFVPSIDFDGTITDVSAEEIVGFLPPAANGEDVNFMPYQNLAGFWMYITSPHSGIYKIPLSSPGTVVDQNSLSFRFGNARIDENRMWGVQRYGVQFSPDLSGLYISNADKATYVDYGAPTINSDVGDGDGAQTNFTGTIPVSAPSTIFNVLIAGAKTAGTSVTDITASGGLVTISSTAHGVTQVGSFVMVTGVTSTGDAINGSIMTVVSIPNADSLVASPISAVATVTYGSGGTLYPIEVFTDNKEGVLTSDAGGTGTINYASGAFDVTFITPPATGTDIIANFFSENATIGGIADFSFASTDPSIGQAYQFQQGGGGTAQAMAGFQGVEYVFHTARSWVVLIPSTAAADYGDASNQQYWAQIGIPYARAQYATGDGIVFIDNTNPAQPKYSVLQIPYGSTNLTVVPDWLSEALDLSAFTFDKAVAFRWGEYDIMACQKSVNGIVQTYNTQFYIRNIASKKWNLLDYPVSCLADYLGALISGDSLSPNLFVLFSGLDDDGSPIFNYWKSAYSNFGFAGQKKVNWLEVEGLIQRDQNIDVYLSLDGGPYTKYFTISGQGAYVSASSPVGVGSNTVGSSVVGGGGAIQANQFTVTIPIFTDYFDNLSFMLQANQVGWAQVDVLRFKDIRLKARKTLPQFQG